MEFIINYFERSEGVANQLISIKYDVVCHIHMPDVNDS